MQAAPGQATAFSFGPFRYDRIRRELRDANGPVHAGSRALQLLEVLLETPGRVCSRDELVGRVWPSTVVEETSLRVHMSALRRILGDGQNGARYITNVPGRGYSFVGDVQALTRQDAPPLAAAPTEPNPVRSRLPARLTRPIGRGHDVAAIGDMLAGERLVTIVGAGGMGKTTVALAVAENQDSLHEQGAVFVDLSALSDQRLVVVEVGQSFGLDVARGEPWVTLENALRDQQVLIVLDNCEQVIDAVASLADRLLRACPRVRLLATSREPLEAEAEWVFRLPPLAVPEPDASMSIDDLLSYPAVQLFVDRARAAGDAFGLTDANAHDVRQLCEFLDGIPLAIELAAARVHTLGVPGLLHRLEDAFELLTRGRRTAMSRHQTLLAVMDWSYKLLTDTERFVLQRLSVFRSAFDLDGAVAVASSSTLPAQRVVEAVMNLHAKSLLVMETGQGGDAPRHRLLYITRLFAERMLGSTPDAVEVRRRHAVFVLDSLRDRDRAQAVLVGFRMSVALASAIAEARAAITWALLEENEPALGMEIVAESTMTWHVAGLMEEFGQHLSVAIDKAKRAGVEGTRLASRLEMTVGLFSAQTLKDSESHRRALSIDRSLVGRFDRAVDKIEALHALCASVHGRGDFLQVLDCCEDVRELAQGELEPLSVAVGDRFSALALHELGQHDAAERLAHRVMQIDEDTLESRFRSALPFSLSMRIRLARICWLRGEFREAWALVQEVVAQDREAHVYAKCHPLALAGVPIAIWKGDLAVAARWNQELQVQATRGNAPYWQAFASVYGSLLEGRPTTPGTPEAQLMEQNIPLMDTVAALGPGAPHPVTLARVRRGEVGWCAPEALRLAALASLDPHDDESRARCIAELRGAWDLSVEQGARFWSLRIAISLCEVTQEGQAEHASAKGLVQSLLNGIDDGSSQPDLQQARRLVAHEAGTAPADRGPT